MFIDVIIQANSSYSDIYVVLQRNVLEIQLKLLFLSCSICIQKVQKVESINIQSDWKTMCKMRDSYIVFTCSGKVWKGGER